MRPRSFYFALFSVGLCLALSLPGLAYAGSTGLITKEELKKELDDPNVVVLDVRTGRDWKSSEFKIKGAVRADMNDFDTWIAKQPKEKRFVTYCA